MPSQTNITNIPSSRVDFIDPRTGLMSREWYRFFLNLFNLTGAGNNPTSLDDLQVGPPIGAGGGGDGTVTSVQVSGGTTGLTTSGGPITSAGTITLAGTLAVANGGTGATTAGGARTNLGATTIGANMFTLANPGAVTFPRFNADNTISALDATSFRTAIGAGTGSGSVTSVAMTTPTGLSISGSPITTSGTLALTYTSGYAIPTTASQTNWDSAYTQRLQWDGGSTNLVASTGRTSLGATTVGGNMFTLTNPSAITFPRFNADNTVSALDAASFRTAIGVGTGTGTVLSVDMTVPTGLAVSGNPITTSGTLAVSYATGYAIPTTASQTNWDSAYTQRLQWDGGSTNLVAATGRTSLGGTTVGQNVFTLTNPSAITFPRFNADNTVSALDAATFRTAIGAGTGSGTVTSVTGTSPVASSGGATPAISLASGYGDTQNPFASKTANYFLAAPNGSAGAPTFRAIVAADIPTLNQNTTGTAAGLSATLAIASGGTGQTTASAAFNALSPITTAGDLIIGNGVNSATRLAIGTNGYVLTSNGTTATWAASTGGVTSFSAGTTGFTPSTGTTGAITLAGTLNIANGGSGATTAQTAMNAFAGAVTSGSYLRGNGTNVVMSAIQAADVPTLNQNTTGTASNVTGTVAIANGGTGATTKVTAFNALTPMTTLGDTEYHDGTNGVRLAGNITSTRKFLRQTGTGTVSAAPAWDAVTATDVGLGNVTNNAQVTSVTGTSPVASSGGTTPAISLASGYGDTQNPYASKTANYMLAAPNGSAGVPTFRALVSADIPSLSYVSSIGVTAPITSTGGLTPTIGITQAGTASNGYLSSTDWNTFNGKGSGTVTAVSVVSANGFAGSSSGGATPALTLSTSVTGVLKGNGTALSAATSGTDYSAGTSSLTTGILKSTTTTGALSIAVAADFPTLNQNTTGTASNVTGTVAIANGGTSATTAAAALTALGAYPASNPSGYTSNTGTVTSVAALTLGTTGTDLSSTVATGTTTPVITLNVPTASATNRGALSAADWTTFNSKGSGTVTAVSVVSANGFAGSSSGGATPALTLSTSITGVLKGNGTALSAATAGTDYSAGTSALTTGILKSTTTTGALSIAVAADFPTLNQNTTGTASNVTGTVAIANGGSGQTTAQTAMNAFAGAVTSGSYLRGNGTNVVMAAIQAADVPTLNQNTTGTASNVTGTVAIANGGTGQTTAAAGFNALSPVTTTGDLIIGNGTNSSTRLPIGANSYVLTSNGTTATWAAGGGGGVTSFSAGTTGFTPNTGTTGAVTLAGTLNVANGGTGLTSLTANYIPYGNGTSAFSNSANFAYNGTYLRVGATTPLSGATNPITAFTGSTNGYVQTYILNGNAGTSASADLVAYADNSTDAHGWADMGFTSSTYADATYTVTGKNEAYLFGSAPTGAGATGNMVYATDSTGSANAHQFYVGGFTQAKGAWKAQIDSVGLKATQINATNGILTNSQTVSANYTIATGDNGLSAGPVSVASGITVTISSGSVWTVV